METRRVTFRSNGLNLVGDLRIPDNAGHKPVPGVVLTGPLCSVKEQVTGNYARRLAEAGFVTLAFDHRNFGESEGEPRQEEDPQGRIHGLRNAVSFLGTLPEVDHDAIGVVGVCLGAGSALHEVAFDPRVKALSLIAGGYYTPAKLRRRFGADFFEQRIREWAYAAQNQFNTGQPEYLPAVDGSGGDAAMPGPEPWEYYGTDRAASPHWVNRVTKSSLWTFFATDDTFAVHFISPTPMLIVHGRSDLYCPPEDAQEIYENAGEPKQIVWLDTTNHIDLYDQEPYVSRAVNETVAWFNKYLTKSENQVTVGG